MRTILVLKLTLVVDTHALLSYAVGILSSRDMCINWNEQQY